MADLGLHDCEKAQFLAAARFCGDWLANGQNTQKRPWWPYRVDQSADEGRFMEKVCLAKDARMPAGVWLTGIYLAGLADLQKTPVLYRGSYGYAIEQGVRFLKSLQCFDERWPKAKGGFYEFRPGHEHSAPRDAATGTMGLIALHQYNGDEDCLERAIRFAEWYSTDGSDPDAYPWDDYYLDKGEGISKQQGDWQAGGLLVYYQLWKVTGDDKWKAPLENGLDKLLDIWANDPGTDTAYDFHGSNVISIGNDDFANTALFAGYMAFEKQAYLDCAAERIRAELKRQSASGAFPGYGGTFVTALELIEVLDLAAEGIDVMPADEVKEPLLRAARFSLTKQETTSGDRFLFGGVYGEGNYAHPHNTVHGRDTGYALQLWLRLAGHRAGMYTVLGW
jgi:hypothetical protein